MAQQKKSVLMLTIPRCNFKGVEEYKSPKNGQVYYTAVFSVGVNDLRLGCQEIDLSNVPDSVLLSVHAEMIIDRFGKLEFSGAEPKIVPL